MSPNPSRPNLSGRVLACLLLLAPWLAAGAAELQQSFQLRPGWNAIFVELEPTEKDISRVFAGLPVASVWRYIPNEGGARFIRDPSEGLDNLEGWFGWFPEPRPEAFLSNLFAISAQTAYLVRLEGSATRTLTISGRPRLLPARWQANAFTLTGLPVRATGAPTFAEYFSASPAHVGQPIYRLSAAGQWQRVTSPTSTQVEPGVAYWIFTRGNSNYQGRLGVILDQSESLEYTAARDEIRVVLRNLSGLPGTLYVNRVAGDGLPLTYLNEDPETGETGWPDLQQSLVLDVEARGEVFLNLGLRRSRFTADRMEEVLEISDDHGQRIWLAAGGNSTQPLALLRQAKGPKSAAVSYAGLWVGEVQVERVSEAQRAGTDPRPVFRPFEQRVLIHVDSSGQARLLKDVIQMWQDGTTRPSSINPEYNEVDVPGRHVLITNPALIGLYSGAVLRDGTPVGLRYSTVAYDFAGREVDFDGVFGPGGEVAGTVVVGSNLPTNPFLHRYHPDHDNLDAQFLNPVVEAYQVTRSMRFRFAVEDPLGSNPPGWGDSIVGGSFDESITGLHKNPIFTSGQFRLRRVSAVPVLNQ